MLAFSFGFAAGTLTLTQTVDDGAIIVDNNGAGDAFQTTDGSGTVTYFSATNLVVNLLDGTGNQLDLDLDNAHTGNVDLNLGDGTRVVNFTGTGNSIDGDLTVIAGAGNQRIELAVPSNFTVGGNALFDLGLGSDQVDENNADVSIGGDLVLTGVNEFENGGTMIIGGNVTMDTSFETETTRFDDDDTMSIGGDFTYTGGDGRDEVLLNDVGATTIAGNVFIDMADNTVSGTQFAWVNDAGTTINGNLTVLSTNSTFADDYQDLAGATINGNILIDLGGGNNDADFFGTIGGSTFQYIGGDGMDDVSYNMPGAPVDLTINLGDGNDILDLGASSSINTNMMIDFGDDMDVFNSLLGTYTFDAQLLGLDGFDHIYTLATDSLESTQISLIAAPLLTIDNNGPGGAIQFINGGTNALTTTSNFAVHLLDGPGMDLDVTLDNPLAGDLTINLGDGIRALNLDGADNSIGGNLTVTSGADDQTVEAAVNAGLTVGGDALFDMGTGFDLVDTDLNDLTVTGNLDFFNVNEFSNDGTMNVGGNVVFDTTADDSAGQFDNDSVMNIVGDFAYLGSPLFDEVNTNSTFSLGGNYLANVGEGGTIIRLNQTSSIVGGTMTLISTDTANTDDLQMFANADIAGNVLVDFGGGTNIAEFRGTFNGTSVVYSGGVGVDTVSYDFAGNPANVNIKLGADDDAFTLGPNASIAPTTLRVDYGGGVDSFTNNFGMFTFNANFLNWDNFNRFYNFGLDQWNMVQLADNGNVTIDNNGPGGAIQLINSYTTNMTGSANVRLNMLPNTGDVAVDLDSPLAGFLVLNVRAGDRNIDFVGSSNTIGGSLFVDAADGAQKVELAVNSPLFVGGHAVINLRTGYDIVDDDGNDVSVANNLIFRGVNEFENEGAVNVGNLTMNTTFEVEKARFDNDGSLNVAGNFTYLGGQEKDDILLNDGANIGGNTFVNLGENISLFAAQNVSLTGGFFSGGFVSVLGGESFLGNSVVTDASTTIGQSFIIDFSANSSGNFAVIDGTFGGNFGLFKGGSGNDVVTMDDVAGDMDFFLQLGDGEDTLNLGSGTSLNYLFVSFGDGVDTFNDEFFGFYPFATAFWQLP